MKIGVDTGFFFLLAQGNQQVKKIFLENEIITSSLVLFEIQKACLKGKLKNCTTLIETLKEAVRVMEIDEDIAQKAAYISYSTGMPAMDALILASLVEAGCKRIFTTDKHLSLYKKRGIKIIVL